MKRALTIARYALIASLVLFPSLARAQYSQTVNSRLPAKTLQGQSIKKKGAVAHAPTAKSKKSAKGSRLKQPN